MRDDFDLFRDLLRGNWLRTIAEGAVFLTLVVGIMALLVVLDAWLS